MHASTQHLRAYHDVDLARLADRLETEALNELRLFLAYIYRLGYHTMLIYPSRPTLERVEAPIAGRWRPTAPSPWPPICDRLC